MSMGPTAEPHNFPPPDPITPSEGSTLSERPDPAPGLPDSGAAIVPDLGIDRPAPGNEPGMLVVPGAPQPDSPIGIMSVPPGTVGGGDAGNADKMESSVQAAVDAANARNAELHSDTLGPTIGDLMDLPDTPSSFGKASGGSNGPLP